MPQFILDHGTPAAAVEFQTLDSFTQGYIEAMFFTNTGPDDAESDLEDASVAELAPDTLERIRRDCAAFQDAAGPLLDRAYERDYSEEQAGRDFWFTRCEHGVGFWDRDPLALGKLGEALSELCGWKTNFSTLDLYRGDDGNIYLS